ncbi:MAG: hypothetical protein GWN58_10425 [Anaerolineae bacterium]|nr:hypothetical protein [Anaerolineae bacterium]
MWNAQFWRRKWFWLVTSLALLILLSAFWALKAWRDARFATNLTPKEVVRAFQNVGFEAKNLKDIGYYPGPMARGEGVEFYTHANDKAFHIIVVMYTSNEKAKVVATEINALNQRMEGGYASALHRGPIVVTIYPSERTVTHKLEFALKEIE